jgi:hypothetical protein
MTSKFLRCGVLLFAMSLPLAAHAQQTGDSYENNFRLCPPDTHSQTFPNGNGYWCVPNS